MGGSGGRMTSADHVQCNVQLSDGKLSPSQIDQYHADGYLVIDGLLPESELVNLRDECHSCWVRVKGPDNFSMANSWLQNSLLPNIHHHSNLVRQYYWEGPLVGVMQQLIGENVKACTSQLTFKLKGNVKDFD